MYSARESVIDRLRGEPGALTEEDRARRGHQARKILESEVFRDAYMDAELELVQSWRDNVDESPAKRERAHAAVKALDILWLTLSRMADDGLVAEQNIEGAAQG